MERRSMMWKASSSPTDNYSGQLLLQTWSCCLLNSRRKSFQTPVYIQHNLSIRRVVDDILVSGHLKSLSSFDSKQGRPDSQPNLIGEKTSFTGSKLSKPVSVP